MAAGTYGRASLIVCGLLLACGPTVAVPQTDGGSTSGGMGEGAASGSADSVGTETFASDGPGDTGRADGTAGDSSEGDAEDSVDGSTGGEPLLGLCETPEGRPIGVANTYDEVPVVSLVFGDGSSTQLGTGDASIPPGANVRLAVAADADTVVVSLGWAQLPSYGEVTHVFDNGGAQQFKRVDANAELRDLAVGSDGVVALRVEGGRAFAGLVLDSAGGEDFYPQFHPSGSIDGTGRIAGRQVVGQSAGTLGWMNTETGVFETAIESADTTWNARFAEGFVYIVGDTMVLESPAESRTIALGAFAGASVANITGSWALLRVLDARSGTTTWGRVDMVRGAVEALDLSAPAGMEHLLCYDLAPVIDPSGAVLLPMRDASVAQLYRLVPGRGWSALGEPVTNVEMMTAYATGDAVVIGTLPSGDTFCPMQVYEPAEGVLAGSQRQVVLPELGITRVMAPNGYGTLRADGRCMTEIVPDAELEVHDLASGESVAVPAVAQFVFVP